MSASAPSHALPERAATTAAPARGTPAKKNRVRPYVVLGIVVAIGLAAYGGFRYWSRGKEGTDDAQVDADVVTISARVGGQVLSVHVRDDQQVKRGDLLVTLDPADLAAKEEQAQAELAAARAQAQAAAAQVQIVEATSRGSLSAARAQLSGSTTTVAGAAARIASAKAALTRAQTQSDQADTDLARAESLFKEQAIPKAQLDASRSGADAARAAVAEMQAQLTAAEEAKRNALTGIAVSQAHVEESTPVNARLAAARAQAQLATANVEAAEAALGQAKLQLSYTRILAPADGALSKLAVRPGQLLQAGQQIVALVPNATYVTANFKETQVGRMHPGDRADVSIDAFPGRTFEGRVASTSPGTGARFSLLPPDNASGNFVKVVQRIPVRIDWLHVPDDVKLAAGMSADVTVSTR